MKRTAEIETIRGCPVVFGDVRCFRPSTAALGICGGEVSRTRPKTYFVGIHVNEFSLHNSNLGRVLPFSFTKPSQACAMLTRVEGWFGH